MKKGRLLTMGTPIIPIPQSPRVVFPGSQTGTDAAASGTSSSLLVALSVSSLEEAQ